MDAKYVVYGQEPNDILKSLRLFTCDDYVVDRIITEKGVYLIKVTEIYEHITFVNYIYFRDITSMLCTIDVLSRKTI